MLDLVSTSLAKSPIAASSDTCHEVDDVERHAMNGRGSALLGVNAVEILPSEKGFAEALLRTALMNPVRWNVNWQLYVSALPKGQAKIPYFCRLK